MQEQEGLVVQGDREMKNLAQNHDTSSTSFSISHKSNTLLRDLASVCRDSTKCACIQRVQTTLSFIAIFKHVCGARSTSDSMYEGVGTLPVGTN
jgi:hypothetical protein